jgi:hypothetical protein
MYMLRRAAQEKMAALRASPGVARDAHRVLAFAYEDRAEAARRDGESGGDGDGATQAGCGWLA